MRASILRKLKRASPIRLQKRLRAEGAATKEESLLFSLNLTTLIDAFCILVIFLLSNMNGRLQNLKMDKNFVLPAAQRSEELQDGLVVRIEKNKFFLDDKAVSKEDVPRALLTAKKTNVAVMIIQADKNSDYENIGMVLRAGGQAGFEKYVFAVLPGT